MSPAEEREDALADFRNGQARVLVATDVAARGCLGKLGLGTVMSPGMASPGMTLIDELEFPGPESQKIADSSLPAINHYRLQEPMGRTTARAS